MESPGNQHSPPAHQSLLCRMVQQDKSRRCDRLQTLPENNKNSFPALILLDHTEYNRQSHPLLQLLTSSLLSKPLKSTPRLTTFESASAQRNRSLWVVSHDLIYAFSSTNEPTSVEEAGSAAKDTRASVRPSRQHLRASRSSNAYCA